MDNAAKFGHNTLTYILYIVRRSELTELKFDDLTALLFSHVIPDGY